MKRCVLVIDSDVRSRRLISTSLDGEEFSVIGDSSYASAFAQFSSENPDIVIINIDDSEGLKTLKTIRLWSALPIIALSADDSEKMCLSALEAGADVFLYKPFSVAELTAYIKVCRRHIEQSEKLRGMKTGGIFKAGDLTVDLDSRQVTVKGKSVHLTKNEFKILSLLCRYSGRVLTYDFIMKSVWGPQTNTDSGILRVNMANIRRKIEPTPESPAYIFTENGVGYRISQQDEETV